MSLADHIFIDMCKDVIENGTSTEGEKVRPVKRKRRLRYLLFWESEGYALLQRYT